MKKTPRTPLALAITVQLRVLADLAGRWIRQNDETGAGCAGCWTRDGVLVIFARGYYADRIAGELERAHLLTPQHDSGRPVHDEGRP